MNELSKDAEETTQADFAVSTERLDCEKAGCATVESRLHQLHHTERVAGTGCLMFEHSIVFFVFFFYKM